MNLSVRLSGLLAAAGVLAGLLVVGGCGNSSDETTIRNVSYDPTREFYKEYNEAFAKYWKEKTGKTVVVDPSHGGSGKQSRAVVDGNKAAVVTLALSYDIDAIQQAGLIAEGWQQRLPNNSCPYTSTIVFLVRAGNPKGIQDWNDLTKDGVEVITPNPKTSGGACWNYLAAWGYTLKRELGDLKKLNDPKEAAAVEKAHAAAQESVAELFRHVRKLDTGARGSTQTFMRGTGDVLLAWENEAFLAINETGQGKVEIVVPSLSILAEPAVSVVDEVVDKLGTREVAEAYLEYLYSAEGQTLAAKHYYRPAFPDRIAKEDQKYLAPFQEKKLELFTIGDVFGGWAKARETHFRDGGTFDQIYKPAGK